MFEDDTVKIPETNFMNWLEQAITREQFLQTTRDIAKALAKRKEDFCKANYYSLQDAKAQLNALITEIMMSEVGFIIDQSMEEYKKQTN